MFRFPQVSMAIDLHIDKLDIPQNTIATRQRRNLLLSSRALLL